MVRMGRGGWGGMKTISGIITSPGLRASPTQCNGGKSSHYCDVLNELNENCSCWAKSRTKHTLLSSHQSHHWVYLTVFIYGNCFFFYHYEKNLLRDCEENFDIYFMVFAHGNWLDSVKVKVVHNSFNALHVFFLSIEAFVCWSVCMHVHNL